MLIKLATLALFLGGKSVTMALDCQFSHKDLDFCSQTLGYPALCLPKQTQASAGEYECQKINDEDADSQLETDNYSSINPKFKL